jgi:hypothetical protein
VTPATPASPAPLPSRLPPYSALEEPSLIFAASEERAHDVHPLRGLVDHGPFSQASLVQFTPTIRVATVGPGNGHRQVRGLVDSLRQSYRPGDRAEYVPSYPGFSQVFGAEIGLADEVAHVKWPNQLRGQGIAASAEVAALLRGAIAQLTAVRGSFDLAFVHLPDAWSSACRSTDFDAHDFAKAIAAVAGVPTQVVNDRVFDFSYLASRSWRLGIAQYVKAGGVPWKLAPIPGDPPDTAFIGLAYAYRGDPTEAHFVTCCSQIFDADGGGMQFVAYEANDPIVRRRGSDGRENPYLSRSDMRAVLARSLRVYQSRNGGLIPRRVAVHKLTGFTEDELAGVFDALSAVDEIECLEINTNVAWRGVWRDVPRTRSGKKSEPSAFPVPRGTLLQLSGTEALLWGAGDAPGVSTKEHFFQGKKSIPRPLFLRRHAGSGRLEIAGAETLALTKMDWNNDALYDPVPVTIRYSRRLAQIIAHVPELPGGEYPYRMFM